MTTRRKFLHTSAASLAGLAAAATSHARMTRITVKVSIYGSTPRQYQFYDRVTGNSFSAVVSERGVFITIGSSGVLEDGYGAFAYRVVGNSTWNDVGLLRHGASHSLY